MDHPEPWPLRLLVLRAAEHERGVLDACPTRVLGFVATGVDDAQDDRYGGFYEHRAGRYPRARERAA